MKAVRTQGAPTAEQKSSEPASETHFLEETGSVLGTPSKSVETQPQTPVHGKITSQLVLDGDRGRKRRGGKTSKTSTMKAGKPSMQEERRSASSHQSSLIGFMSSVSRALLGSSSSSQDSPAGERSSYQQGPADRQREELNALLEQKDAQIARIRRENADREKSRKTEIQGLKETCYAWEEKANLHLRETEELRQERDDTVNKLNAQLKGLREDAKASIEEHKASIHSLQQDATANEQKYHSSIRKLQEASFNRMESGNWVPSEESKIVDQLERLRRQMRAWAKSVAIKDMSALVNFEDVAYKALKDALSHVVKFSGNQLPPGLSTAKATMVLLNALLAHAVFMSYFQTPFFFLGNGTGDFLNAIYQKAQKANPHDAHYWRSQTMRLLLPPLAGNISDGEKAMRSTTESLVAGFAERQALDFLHGPAQQLMKTSTTPELGERLNTIYREAAALAYQLWTRRTAMTCRGLRDLRDLLFDNDSEFLVPHTLVHPDEHEDHLKGRPFTIVVHPLLLAFGTEEGADYESGRVWARAEVWLDSK